MKQFLEYITETADEGRTINIMFEERLFALVGTLEKISTVLAAARISFELIGGGAVMVHVNAVEPSAVRNTKDLDIMVHRTDLERIKEVAAQHGFTFRHAAGVDMLLPPGETKAMNAVHLVFTGEKVKASQAIPNPPLRPEHVSVHGVQVAVISVSDLVQMKLSNNRDIDRVHVDDLDLVGLVTPEIEKSLPANLHARLQEIRGNR
jgi:hypothetical protein